MTKNPIVLVALATAALALGACGSDAGDDSGTGASRQKQEDKEFAGALKFAKCMRDHGIDMPDPKRVNGGGIQQRMEGGRLPQAKVEAAQKACEHFMEQGGGPPQVNAKDEAEHRDALLAYAKCMRAHGVDMEDPKFASNGRVTMGFKRGGGPSKGGGPDSPAFKAADQACHPQLAAVERKGDEQ